VHYNRPVFSDRERARSYAQVCGIAAALDIVGERWALLVARDLLLGPLRFGDLAEGLPGIGTNTLAARLRHLETVGVVQRRAVPLPERGTVYELTPYGRELEPILLALGRWGTRSMGHLPAGAATRSRWLVTALLAFHEPSREVARPTTWELRLTEGTYTVRAEGAQLAIEAGPAAAADLTVTTDDAHFQALVTRQLSPEAAVATGVVGLEGDPAALALLVDQFAFPVPGEETVG